MHVSFFYQPNLNLKHYEAVITAICNRAELFLELPSTLDVHLYRLNPSTYGGIDHHKLNSIVLSTDLQLKSIPMILVHELIHVSQRHTNMLRIYNDGSYVWMGKFYTRTSPELLPKDEYLNLPWELDVNDRLPLLLKKILDTHTIP